MAIAIALSCAEEDNKEMHEMFFCSDMMRISIDTVADITDLSAICYGALFDYSSDPDYILACGVFYGKTAQFNLICLGFRGEDNDFFTFLVDLEPNTTYYVKPFAININNDTVFGAEMNFKTAIYLENNLAENDFSNQSDWSYNYFSGGNANAFWSVTSNAPQGQYSGSMGKINSTTASNGFAMFDSDFIGTNLGYDNQYSIIYLVQSMNCVDYNTVVIEFDQYYKRFKDSTYISVSYDGDNWFLYSVNSDMVANDITVNANRKSVNISSIAANQPFVYIGFVFWSEADGGAYAWMVDDVKVKGSSLKSATDAQFLLPTDLTFNKPQLVVEKKLK